MADQILYQTLTNDTAYDLTGEQVLITSQVKTSLVRQHAGDITNPYTVQLAGSELLV